MNKIILGVAFCVFLTAGCTSSRFTFEESSRSPQRMPSSEGPSFDFGMKDQSVVDQYSWSDHLTASTVHFSPAEYKRSLIKENFSNVLSAVQNPSVALIEAETRAGYLKVPAFKLTKKSQDKFKVDAYNRCASQFLPQAADEAEKRTLAYLEVLRGAMTCANNGEVVSRLSAGAKVNLHRYRCQESEARDLRELAEKFASFVKSQPTFATYQFSRDEEASGMQLFCESLLGKINYKIAEANESLMEEEKGFLNLNKKNFQGGELKFLSPSSSPLTYLKCMRQVGGSSYKCDVEILVE